MRAVGALGGIYFLHAVWLGVCMALPSEEAIIRIVQAGLNTIGAAGAEEMRSFLREDAGVDTERLRNSISFASMTATDRSRNMNVKNTDWLEKPNSPFAVNIGTANPYAPYVNYGSLPIGRGGGSAEPEEGSFREKILQWAIHKWGDSEETRARAMGIAKAIAEHGTDAIPFFEPSFTGIRMAARKGLEDIVAGIGASVTPTVTVVGPTGNVKKYTGMGRGGWKRAQ